MSTPLAEPPSSARLPTSLLVASTLCWIQGILLGFGGFVFLLFLPEPKVGAIIAVVVILLGVVYCVSGYLIRKGRLAGGWMGIVPAGFISISGLYALITPRSISLSTVVTLAVNLGIVLSLLFNWRRLRTWRTRVGA